MSSFTENLYLRRAIQKLQEENQQLLKLLNEVQNPPPMFPGGNPPPPPSIPPSGPFPFPPQDPSTSPRPLPTPNPPINPKSVGQRSASQGGGLDYLDPMYGRGRFPLQYDRNPNETPLPSSMPFNQKTPLPFTLPANQPFSLNRPYDPNDDPNNFRPTRGMGDGGI